MLVASLVVLVTVCVALLAFATTRPDSYSLQRVMSINASPERILSLLCVRAAPGSYMRWLGRAVSVVSSLAVNAPLIPCFAEQTLCEIEPPLGFCCLLLEPLDITFKCLQPRSDVGRW